MLDSECRADVRREWLAQSVQLHLEQINPAQKHSNGACHYVFVFPGYAYMKIFGRILRGASAGTKNGSYLQIGNRMIRASEVPTLAPMA